ncbi:hypothetical protein GA0061096_4011 [Fictibacillus enclensis]|uniref:Uncharacterized protein n=1 Tax=Fictibacillus enclensis TaxID=1017270 RepID=A0A0V8J1S6_9BACL|nr:DUF3784 domain-containing protein [Fictibacillus enclensis]KSU81057.1 hypothetical protein AS030_19105 [Fictibacillus enclensis]SCC34597.1 hypothetical protein GA0061096_4011 [Fictibacillus enclensis]
MNKVEETIETFIDELNVHLTEIQTVHRENYVAEIKDHLYSYAKDLSSQGLSEKDIEHKIREEFVSMNELAEDFINSTPSPPANRFKNNSMMLPPLLVGALGIFIFPNHQELLVALMLFIYAYLVLIKKAIWGFAVVRKKPSGIKNREKVSQSGSVYLFVLGLLFLIGEFVSVPNKNIIFATFIALLSIGFFFYVQKKLVR